MSTRMALSTVYMWCVCIFAAADCSNEQGNSIACAASEDVSSLLQNGFSLDGEGNAASTASYSVSESDASTAESSVEGVHTWLGQEEDQSQDLTVTFGHQGKEHQYELLPHSVYKEGAQIYSGSELLEMEPPRTYRARDDGKWASMTLHEDGTVQGLFEDDGRVMEIKPVAHQEPEVVASMLQDYEGDSPAHLIRWVGAPDLQAKASLVQTDGSGTPTTVNDDGHVPDDSTGPGPIEEEKDPKFGGSSASWGGVKWWPGCYAGDKDQHEFIMGFAADKAAVDKEGSQSALKSKLDSIVNEASFVYEKQMNIKLKLDYLKMATSNADFGSCPNGNEMSNKLNEVKGKVSSGALASRAAVHLWTGCGAKWGVVGLAYVGTICGGSYATGSNKIHGGNSPWLTFAHELGHNFRGKHSFEDGQGKTGGIMDYGDGKLNGHYQFNTKYRKTQVCGKLNSVVNKCSGHFQKDSGAAPAPQPTPVPTAPPPTTTTIPPPPGTFACSFESGSKPYCGLWEDAKGDKFDWSRKSGKTPSSNTGPDKASDGSNYLFIEASSPRQTNDNAILKTNQALQIGSAAFLRFDYHMKGNAIDTLKVSVSEGGTSDVVFEKKKAQGSNWNSANIDLAKYTGKSVTFAIEANRGSSWSGDIAIDNVNLFAGTPGGGGPPAATTGAPPATTQWTPPPSTTGWSPSPTPSTTQSPPPPPANGDLAKKIAQLEGTMDQILKLLKSLTGGGR